MQIRRTHFREEHRPLLLLADPNWPLVEEYLKTSLFFEGILDKEVLGGILVLEEKSGGLAEIRNVSVAEAFQRQGIGRELIQAAMLHCEANKAISLIRICTANSSIHQLRLYQRLGFEMVDVNCNYFVENYPEPIFEDGMACKHQIVLEKKMQ